MKRFMISEDEKVDRLPYLLSPVMIAICIATVSTVRAQSAADPAQAVLNAEAQRVAVMSKVKDTVLAVFDSGGQGGGSGVVISADGFALTNFHVVQPCGKAMKCGMADGHVYDGVLVGLDPTGDVALIQVLGRGAYPHAELGDSDRLRAGDPVFAMGNPFLLATDFQPTVTLGIISGVHRYQFPDGTLLEYADCLQTDASINPGNSGGPLFDSEGRLMGINGRCSFDKRGRVSVNVGYSISINQIKNFIGYLHSGRIVDHATLGARVSSDDQGRVVVSDILEQSDAYRRGLRADDEIVSFAGREITTPNGFKNALGIYPKGWRVPLSYRRDGKRYDVMVRLAGVHAGDQLLEKTLGRPPDMPQPKRGRKNDKKGPDRPMQLQAAPPKEPIPEIVKKRLEERHGYANYFYNKQEQDRILKEWKSPFDAKTAASPSVRGTWTLAGKLEGGAPYRFHLNDLEASLLAPIGETKWAAGPQFDTSLMPEGSGGLLPALYLWRRFCLDGSAAFTEFYDLGAAPLVGHDGLADVVVGSYRGVECWFYIDPSQGQLLVMEMYAPDRGDPCEIRFLQYRDVDGRYLPGRLEVRSGDELFGVFKLEEVHFEEADKKS